jgi:hypothetical protein
MNRILKRPMFRLGGSTNGIMTGLERPGYSSRRFNRRRSYGFSLGKTSSNIAKEMYPQRPTDINKFLINFGLDLVSRSPQGGLLSTAATAAKAPTQQLYQDIEKQKEGRTELESGLFGALVKARGEALSGGEGTRLAKLAYKDEVININKQLRDNYNKFQNEEN